jgi:serine/threonine-protein kinase
VLQLQRQRREIPSADVAPARVSLNLAPGIWLGPYRIVRELGEGVAGVTYEAVHGGGPRRVALKVLRPGLLPPGAKVRLEAALEPGEIGEADDLQYVAFEFIEGTPLARLLERRTEPPARVAGWIAEAAEQLAGTVHGDLHPSNIIVDAEGRARVTDWAIGAAASAADPAGWLARLGMSFYAAPDQVRGGGGPATAASDLHALAVILYEGVAGVPPFLGDSPGELHARILEGRPRPPGRLNPAVDEILERIILAALGERYPDAGRLAEDLRKWLAGDPVRLPGEWGLPGWLARLWPKR